LIKHSKEELEKLGPDHINSVLEAGTLNKGDSHQDILAKHQAIKDLARKLDQKAELDKDKMDESKETHEALQKLIEEQKKTLKKS